MSIEGLTDAFCDNEVVTNDASKPETTLAKRHNTVAFHKVQEATTMHMVRVAWKETSANLADLLKKTKMRAE